MVILYILIDLEQIINNQINKHLQQMNTSQQFQLKIGVYHHATLKTDQLIEFLKNQSNDFLANELPQNLMIRETFYSVFDIVNPSDLMDFNQFVGFIILYSSSSRQTFQYAKSCLPVDDQLTGQQFLLFVQMDNTEKKSNVIGSEGQQLCKKRSVLFIRLTLKNPQDLVANLNRNIYMMIENYYYPNQQEKNKQSGTYEPQINPNEFILQYSQSEQVIIADVQQKNKMFSMINKATTSRKYRQTQMVVEQSAIDESIENVEKVLNNINRHIKEKLESNWFTNLKNSLYKPIEKESKNYNKIKLTQEFIDEVKPKNNKQVFTSKAKESRYRENIYHSKYNSSLQQSFKKLDSSLMKIMVMFDQMEHEKVVSNKIVEIEVFQTSNYEQLATNALKKLEIFPSESNMRTMIRHIKLKIETYVKQLSRAIRDIERQRTFERSYLDVHKK